MQNQSCRDVLPPKRTLPQKPMEQTTVHSGGMHKLLTHTSQHDAFTAYLPSLHLSNHTHHKIIAHPHTHMHTQRTLQHTLPSKHHHPQLWHHINNHPHILIHNDYNSAPYIPCNTRSIYISHSTLFWEVA